jgi:hypothetical protein
MKARGNLTGSALFSAQTRRQSLGGEDEVESFQRFGRGKTFPSRRQTKREEIRRTQERRRRRKRRRL